MNFEILGETNSQTQSMQCKMGWVKFGSRRKRKGDPDQISKGIIGNEEENDPEQKLLIVERGGKKPSTKHASHPFYNATV